MIIHDVKQGSDEWLQLRLGVPTASEMSHLITPTLKVCKGKGVDTYLYQKLAEKWLGQPLEQFVSFAMDQGSISEETIYAIIGFETKLELRKVGFITTDDGRIGCSPDAEMLPDSGAEIKAPRPQTHVSYLIRDELPREYAPQVYAAMLVTGAKRWEFFSFARRFPLFRVTVQRDDKVIDLMRGAIDAFNDRFDVAWERLLDLNCGPPKPRNYTTAVEPDGTEVRTLIDENDAAAFEEFLNSPGMKD